MKQNRIAIAIVAASISLALPSALPGADPHGHDHGARGVGPNGGRVITATEPHYELLVTPERKVKITFLDEAGKPAALRGQSASATGGDRANPTRFAFAEQAGSLLSDKPLPEGTLIPLILQVKIAPDGKVNTVRLNVNLADCATCKHKEYACTCAH